MMMSISRQSNFHIPPYDACNHNVYMTFLKNPAINLMKIESAPNIGGLAHTLVSCDGLTFTIFSFVLYQNKLRLLLLLL